MNDVRLVDLLQVKADVTATTYGTVEWKKAPERKRTCGARWVLLTNVT